MDLVVWTGHIQEKILKNANMSIEEYALWCEQNSELVKNRMEELGIDYPWRKINHPDVRLIEGAGTHSSAFRLIQGRGLGMEKKVTPYTVICSIILVDHRLWLHVSVSSEKIPGYKILSLVKDIFIGEDKAAIQVFPVKQNYVNDHKTCLHLWSCLEGEILPRFDVFGTI